MTESVVKQFGNFMDRSLETPSQTFCVLPWIHRFTNIGGEIQVCCTSEESDNSIRDQNDRPILSRFRTEEIMNSTFMKNLRVEMLNGRWPALCYRCKVTEDCGGFSRRINENFNFSTSIPTILKETEDDGSLSTIQIKSFDIRLGNTCNLACRMCHPRASSNWVRDWPKVDQDLLPFSSDELTQFRRYNWYKSPMVLLEFYKQLPNLQHIHFAGGEPLVIPEMIEFLKISVESGYSKNIELTYNTNLTILPDAVKKLWPHFRAVKLLVSLDGYGPLNEFIRHPSRWKTIDRNLREIDLNFKALGITEVQIMSTVQIYNIFGLSSLYDYLALNFKNIKQLPLLIDLHNPSYYRTQILPQPLKLLARERLEDILTLSRKRILDGIIPESQKSHLNSLVTTSRFLDLENREDLIPDFRRAAESKDRFRNQDVYSVVPELKRLLEPPMSVA